MRPLYPEAALAPPSAARAESPSQGICCHLFAAAGGLMVAARSANSAGLGKGFLDSVGAWACVCRAGSTRRATQSNRRAPETKLVRDMIVSAFAGRLRC